MPEGENTETLELPTSSYFSEEFIQNAPIEEGVEAVTEYLIGNLHGEVITVLQKAEPDRSLSSFPKEAKRVITDLTDDLIEAKATAIAETLSWYTSWLEAAYRIKAKGQLQATYDMEMLKRGVGSASGHLRIQAEREIIEQLLEKAAALSYPGSQLTKLPRGR